MLAFVILQPWKYQSQVTVYCFQRCHLQRKSYAPSLIIISIQGFCMYLFTRTQLFRIKQTFMKIDYYITCTYPTFTCDIICLLYTSNKSHHTCGICLKVSVTMIDQQTNMCHESQFIITFFSLSWRTEGNDCYLNNRIIKSLISK